VTDLTQAQIDKLRGKPHNTKLWLSIYQPTTILACRVNDSDIETRDYQITYDGVTEGNYLLIQEGMTALIGSSAGASDKGTIRIRSATPTVLTTAENSEIEWEDNDHITILNFYEINAIFPRIIKDPADELKTIWYKDYDIAYTDQNDVLGSFICMGSHYAGFLSGTGTCQVYYSATGTWDLFDGEGGYDWFFEGATNTGSAAIVPGWVTYDTAGHYTTRLIVSGSAGGVDTSYRHVSIYDRPSEGTNIPLLSWELVDFSGNREQGGYIVSVKIFENVSESIIKDGALVVIFADDWYGSTREKVSIGGNQENREEIVFVGYIVNGSIKYDYKSSIVEFSISSPTITAQDAVGFGVSIRDSASPAADAAAHPELHPSAWMLVKNLTVARGLYHYLRWQSTLMKCADFKFQATDRSVAGQDFDRASLYDAMNTFMWGALYGRVVSDKQGKIWAEREIYTVPLQYPTGTFSMGKRDWVGEPDVAERMTEETSYVEMGGVAYDGSITGSTPYLSGAPGLAPGYRGDVQRIQGLALQNQAELNVLSGYVYRYQNVRYPDLEFDIGGNYRNFDLAPQEIIPIIINAEDTRRNTLINIPSSIKSIDFSYRSDKEVFRPRIVFTELPEPFLGETVLIPVTPPIDPPTIPPIPPPPPLPWPDPIPIEPPEPTGTTATTVGYFLSNEAAGTGTSGGLWKTEDFTATGTQPVWTHVAVLDDMDYLHVDESDPENYVYMSQAKNSIYRWTPGGGSVQILTVAQAKALLGEDFDGGLFYPWVDRVTGYVYSGYSGQSLFGDLSYVLKSVDHGATWTNQTPGGVSFTRGASYITALDGCVWVGWGAGITGAPHLAVSPSDGANPFYTKSVGISSWHPQLQIDPNDRLTCYSPGYLGTKYYKAELAGAVVNLTDLGEYSHSTKIDNIWINPDDSNHQRAFKELDYYETLDGWNSISFSDVLVDRMDWAGQLKRAEDYSWWSCVSDDDNIYATSGNGVTEVMRMGANHGTPPYTDSLPPSVNTAMFGLWHGGSPG